ncbi:MAG: glycerol-3-phosphate 1-O-acyltransferase PlsY [Firmicutes bacterium]|nr:glycerol-3-phosphate 1-O-acyltransferase PlsY [Bacillota bacterium]
MPNCHIALAIVLIVVAYFIGNISPATIISKAHGRDIRKEGSGNPGTTNMLRTQGKKAAGLTLLVDVLKGVVAVLIGRYFGGEYLAVYCAVAVIFGHLWPVCFKFKGGKGIATGLGLLLALSVPMGLICLAAAIVFFVTVRIVSIGSIAATIAMPICAWFLCPEYFPWSLLVMVAVLFKHRANIGRLIRKEEPKFSLKKK